MTKESIEKAQKRRSPSVNTKRTGIVRTWFRNKISTIECKKGRASQSIEMDPRNQTTLASNEQTGRVQALRNWFGASFGRKARGFFFLLVILTYLPKFFPNNNHPRAKFLE